MISAKASSFRFSAPGFWLGALTFAALLVRRCIAWNDGIWRDEGLFLAIVRMPRWRDTIDFLKFHESHPPLFYAMMRAWLKLGDGSDHWALSLVLITGSLLVPALYFAGKRLYNIRVGFVAALVATFSPVLIEHASMIRPYPLLQLLVLVSVVSLVVALEEGRIRWWALFAVSTSAMVYTHNWMWLPAAGEAAAFAIIVIADDTARRRRVVCASVAATFIGVAFLPWAPTFAFQSEHAGYPPLNVDVFHVLFLAPFTLQVTVLPGVGNPRQKLIVAYAATLFALVLAILWFYRRTMRKHKGPDVGVISSPQAVSRNASRVLVITCAITLVLALALSFRSNLLQSRCLAILTPLLILFLSASAERQWRLAVHPLGKTALACTAALMFGLYAGGINRLATTDRSNARALANLIGNRSRPSDLVIVIPEWLASSFNHYFKPPNEQIDFPHEGREEAVDFAGLMPRMSDPAALRRTLSRVNEARASRRRVWLISEWPLFMPLDSPSFIRMVDRVPERLIIPVRVAQVRETLERLYGLPDTSTVTDAQPVRYERLVAYLFSPAITDSTTGTRPGR
jgi:4-amino-4-deoxy-L-arabinose transferase-like glycosyltransferase